MIEGRRDEVVTRDVWQGHRYDTGPVNRRVAMANVNTKAHVLVRDRFVCQFCGGIVFVAQAIRVLDWHVPGLELWDAHGRKEPLRSRWATVDHLVPEIKGGTDVLANLVACCVTCNSLEGTKPSSKLKPGDNRATVGVWFARGRRTRIHLVWLVRSILR